MPVIKMNNLINNTIYKIYIYSFNQFATNLLNVPVMFRDFDLSSHDSKCDAVTSLVNSIER